jgi:hypothetical protein
VVLGSSVRKGKWLLVNGCECESPNSTAKMGYVICLAETLIGVRGVPSTQLAHSTECLYRNSTKPAIGCYQVLNDNNSMSLGDSVSQCLSAGSVTGVRAMEGMEVGRMGIGLGTLGDKD